MKNNSGEKREDTRNFGINIVAVDSYGKSLGLDGNFPGDECPDSGDDIQKVSCSDPLPEQSKIQMKMIFPEKEELNLIKANGTVKWVRQVKRSGGKYFVIGVHFKEISSREKQKITKLWRSNLKK